MPNNDLLKLADDLPKAFVVGCQKSGTTWLQLLLAAHPNICSRGEACFGTVLLPLIMQVAQAYNQNQRAGKHNTIRDSEVTLIARTAINSLFARWLDAEPDPGSIRLIAEKTPEHAVTLDALGALFPESRVVHIIRDGRDGVVSGWRHNLRENETNFRSRFPTMAHYAAYFAQHHWTTYINTARSWGARHPARYLELRYEDLLAEPAGHTRDLLEFLGVNAGEADVRECVERSSFRALSGRDAGETDNSSHFRRGVVGSWESELDRDAVLAFERAAGPMMRQLGYAA